MRGAIAIATAPAVPHVDPTAPCTTCGRLGTRAIIALGDPPQTVSRYCRRCWPDAHRAALRSTDEQMAAYERTVTEWTQSDRVGSPLPASPGPGSRYMSWHLSLALGTLWREFQHVRKQRSSRHAAL
jgi:hypothetical protein